MFNWNHVTLSRRSVLKTGILVGTALAVGVPSRRMLKANPDDAAATKIKKQIGFLYDEGKCIECQACAQACKKAYHWEEGVQWRKVVNSENGHRLSISCNHCEDPACVKVCPVGAYTKRDDGIVIHDSKKCVGCGYCLYACPYHAPQFGEKSGAVSKCHFCYEMQDKGFDPVCVRACPVKALTIGEMPVLLKKGSIDIQGLPDPKMTKPSLVVIPMKK